MYLFVAPLHYPTSAEFINSEGNTSYYLEGDRLLKVVTDVPEAVSMCSAIQNTDGTLTTSAEIDIKFYEADPLTEEQIALLRAGEGVVPQTSSLYWTATGDIYTNGEFAKRGKVGTTINYSTPTFSNVSMMPSNQTIDPVTAGVEYTLNCTRGVTIYVRIPFAT